jgi:hypothetical protein
VFLCAHGCQLEIACSNGATKCPDPDRFVIVPGSHDIT